MKWPLKRNGLAPTSHPGAGRFAAALLCGLFALVVGCTGQDRRGAVRRCGRFEHGRCDRFGPGGWPDGR